MRCTAHYCPMNKQIMDSLTSGKNVFITGKAGTGKSTLIGKFCATTTRNVLVCAPTGIAALNVGGMTIHRLFGFSPKTTLGQIKSGRWAPGRFADELASADTLVIDEASMLRADLFDMICAALIRVRPKTDKPFGGVQIVLVGDLFQLPPVVASGGRKDFARNYDSEFFFSAHCFNIDDFDCFELEKVYRQSDPKFVEVLNQIRIGQADGAVGVLNERVQASFEAKPGQPWVRLAPTNKVADACNARELAKLGGQRMFSQAISIGDTKGFDAPVAEELELAVGAQVMLVNNDPLDRWVNGSMGKVFALDHDDIRVGVELDSGERVWVGMNIWDINVPTFIDGQMEFSTVGSFAQLPIKLAWAITVHKSQGKSFKRVLLDASGRFFAPGQLYVALSRARSLDGLVLNKRLKASDVKVDERVVEFMAGINRR